MSEYETISRETVRTDSDEATTEYEIVDENGDVIGYFTPEETR